MRAPCDLVENLARNTIEGRILTNAVYELLLTLCLGFFGVRVAEGRDNRKCHPTVYLQKYSRYGNGTCMLPKNIYTF